MRTLEDLLRALFPNGTRIPDVLPLRRASSREPVYSAPDWPPDLFALCGKLLDLSGAYHHVVPVAPTIPSTGVRRLQLTLGERRAAEKAGAAWAKVWRTTPTMVAPRPAHLDTLWTEFHRSAGSDLYEGRSPYDDAPAWWRLALQMFIIADEASREVGFELAKAGFAASGSYLLRLIDMLKYVEGEEPGQGDDNFFSASFANRDIVCVMPKSRTPRVGCTLRSLSHHLALLPPRGEVRARWFSPYGRDPGPGLDAPFKVMIVPFPYAADDACFEAVGGRGRSGHDWGWFEVRQRWLGDAAGMADRAADFADFVVDLVGQASARGAPVGAVVVPEAALNERFYGALAEALLTRTGVELLVNGSGESPVVREGRGATRATRTVLRPGNFVSQTLFFEVGGKRQAMRSVREKHHRWRLERTQIEQYGLQARLDPAMFWWERIDITERSIDVMPFRPGATITSLICEDLARVDPCQAAVRAIGPTLLFSLLMDGSQIDQRWPARYATVLTEDPGCSVLTVTSLALIDRTVPATIGGGAPQRSVALWRDLETGVTKVELAPGAHAVTLTLLAVKQSEGTLEGRVDDADAVVWRLEKSDPVHAIASVTAAGAVPAWIAGAL